MPAISEDIFKQALRDAGLATVDDVVRVVDCRLAKLHDPGKQPGSEVGEILYHCGTWPDTFSTFCDAITPDDLENLSRTYVSALQEAQREQATQVIIFFYCKSGHHRSVAMATVLQHLLEATKGCLRSEVINTCESQWWQNCGASCQEPHAICLHPYNLKA